MTSSQPLITQADGRWAQKQRTRGAILDAASEIVAEGTIPTIPQSAQRARVSPATAYRYFSSQEALLAEVTLPMAELLRAFESASHLDVPTRVGAMVRATAEWCYDHQTVLREMLRATLDRERDYSRPRHRSDLIDRALGPMRDEFDPATYRRLNASLSLYFGIDPIVVLDTITDLGKDEGIETLVWGATTLARAQIDEYHATMRKVDS